MDSSRKPSSSSAGKAYPRSTVSRQVFSGYWDVEIDNRGNTVPHGFRTWVPPYQSQPNPATYTPLFDRSVELNPPESPRSPLETALKLENTNNSSKDILGGLQTKLGTGLSLVIDDVSTLKDLCKNYSSFSHVTAIDLSKVVMDRNNIEHVHTLLGLLAQQPTPFKSLKSLTLGEVMHYLDIPELHNLESLVVGNIDGKLSLPPLPNLKSLVVGTTHIDLVLPELPKLESLAVGDMWTPLTLPELPKLESLTIGKIHYGCKLTLPELSQLLSLVIGDAHTALTLPDLPKLESLTIGDISPIHKLVIPKLPKLKSLTIGDINGELTLPELPKLVSLAVGNIHAELTLPEIPKLKSLTTSNIHIDLTLPELPQLVSLAVGNIYFDCELTLPELPKLKSLVFKNFAARAKLIVSPFFFEPNRQLQQLNYGVVNSESALETLEFFKRGIKARTPEV